MKKQAPCYKCTRRSQICHASCKEYFDWVAEVKKEHDNARKGIEAAAYANESHAKWERRRNLR